MLCADDTSGPAGSASDHRNHTSATGAALCPFMPETGAMTCLFNLEQDPSEPSSARALLGLPPRSIRLAPDLRSLPLVAAERKNVASENLDVVKRLLGRIASYNSTHVPNTAWPRFDNTSCPQPQPMTKDTVWMPWRKDGGGEAGPRAA